MFPINVPNVLTVLRILAVPVIVVALLGESPDGDLLAGIVFALAALTDGLDGYIARSRGSVTTFGKLMDPIADKLLIVAALVALVSLDRLAAWVAMVIIAREIAVTGLRGLAVEQGVVISASWLGKVKTVLQVAAVFALIIWYPAPLAVDVLVYAAVAMTVISGLDYFFGVRRRIVEERERRALSRPPPGPRATRASSGGGASAPPRRSPP
jgi:CDP-diacylglycerol--glycerol-3-phosphate 3-phosphatidyltransferase